MTESKWCDRCAGEFGPNHMCFKLSALEVRVKELEAEHLAEHQAAVDMFGKYDAAREENARLRKALEIISRMGQQTKDGHRIHGPWTIAKEALREVDGATTNVSSK